MIDAKFFTSSHYLQLFILFILYIFSTEKTKELKNLLKIKFKNTIFKISQIIQSSLE